MKRAIRVFLVIALFLSVGAIGKTNFLGIADGVGKLGLAPDLYLVFCGSNTVRVSMKDPCFNKDHLVDQAKKDLNELARFILGSDQRIVVRFEVVRGNVNCKKRTDSCLKIIQKILKNGNAIEVVSKGDDAAPLVDPFENPGEFSLWQDNGAAVRRDQGL